MDDKDLYLFWQSPWGKIINYHLKEKKKSLVPHILDYLEKTVEK